MELPRTLMKESGCVQQEIVSPDLLWGHSAPSLPPPHTQALLSPLGQCTQPPPPASPNSSSSQKHGLRFSSRSVELGTQRVEQGRNCDSFGL